MTASRSRTGQRIAGFELDRFVAGGALSQEAMDKLASYIFTGHKRYDAETDTLVSMNTAAPMRAGISMPKEAVDAAIQVAGGKLVHPVGLSSGE